MMESNRTSNLFLFLAAAVYFVVQGRGSNLQNHPLDTPLHPSDTNGSFKTFKNDDHIIQKRAAIRDPSRKWPGAIVYYTLDPAYSAQERSTIFWALAEISEKTCVRFIQRTTEPDFVRVGRPKSGCGSDFVGRKGGQQDMYISPECLDHSSVMHEMMHVLGFIHVHQRPDRDHHVNIHHDKIKENLKGNFDKYTNNKVDTLDLPYDFESVMHYRSLAFPKNGEATITTKDPENMAMIGQRLYLSPLDAQKIRKLYNINDTTSSCQQRRRGETFMCASSGRYIHYNWVCDGEDDCDDLSDEMDCGEWRVTLFQHKNYEGRSLTVSGRKGECVNILGRQNSKDNSFTRWIQRLLTLDQVTSSVNTHGGCIRLYELRDCKGNNYRRLDPSRGNNCDHANLVHCNFNDKASSVGSC